MEGSGGGPRLAECPEQRCREPQLNRAPQRSPLEASRGLADLLGIVCHSLETEEGTQPANGQGTGKQNQTPRKVRK